MAAKTRLKRVDPVPESEMEKTVNANTICSILRDAYGRTRDKEVRLLIRVAVAMAKKMSNKLEWYYEKTHTDRGWEKEVFGK